MRRTLGRTKADSFAEARTFFLILALAAGVFLLPQILRAIDANGDNLDDAWEAKYGITTNVYDPAHLLGWWQMDVGPNVTDRSTNHLDGTLTGFPDNPYATGLFSNALAFVPSASVAFSAKPVLNLLSGFTFSAWLRAPLASTHGFTLARWTDAASNSWTVSIHPDGLPALAFLDAHGHGVTLVAQAGSDTTAVNDDTWHHLAATWNDRHKAVLYVDGESQAQGIVVGWHPDKAASFTLGGANTDPFALDEVRLYNRTLGPGEICQLPVTYTDLAGRGISVREAERKALDPRPPPGTTPPEAGDAISIMASSEPSAFTPWMPHDDFEQFQRQFDSTPPGGHPNYWDKGHWIDAAECRWNDGHIEYRISYSAVPPNRGRGWYWYLTQPPESFDRLCLEFAAKGYTLVHTNSFTNGDGELLYQGVWHKLNPPTASY